MKPNNTKQVFTCYLKILSPVHIGCDEVYEPSGFVVDESQKQLIVFDPFMFIRSLSPEDKNRFADICKKGNVASILEIYKFLRNRQAEGRPINVCNGFLTHYKNTLNVSSNDTKRIEQELNKFLIPRTAFNTIDQRPYLPGSGIKGALRTAYLNDRASVKNLRRQRDAKQLEKILLKYRSIPDDPFRLVKVSDFKPVGDAPTRIVYGVNQKKKITAKQPRGLPLLFEIIQPGAVFEGVITVEQPLRGAGVQEPVNLNALLESAYKFFSHEKQREERELRQIGFTNFFETPAQGTGLIRCGRHSGAEAVTIAGHRDIRIMLGRGKKTFLDHATTVWLASESKHLNQKNAIPFGWIQVGRLGESKLRSFEEQEDQWRKKDAQKRQARFQAIEQVRLAKKQAAVIAARKAEEKARLQKAEAERKAAFEAMTPEEKELVIFSEKNIRVEKVNTLFNKIDKYSKENQIKLAKKLKQYWKDNKKWTKKDVGQKQWKKVRAKVNKIDTILKGDVE